MREGSRGFPHKTIEGPPRPQDPKWGSATCDSQLSHKLYFLSLPHLLLPKQRAGELFVDPDVISQESRGTETGNSSGKSVKAGGGKTAFTSGQHGPQ